MSKLYQRIEAIFKFRLMDNSGINEYLRRMSSMGKIDDVKKIALFNLILTVLGEMEDRDENKNNYNIANPNTLTFTTNTGGSNKNGAGGGAVAIKPTDLIDFKCSDCGFVAKSKFGLISHSRKHKM
jgi:hypothetical protein